MAKLHSNLPKHRGEIDLASQLKSLDDDKLHLWFSLDFIPGVRDIDALVWHESAGVFTVEVKAVPLDMVESFGYNECTIKGRNKRESPQQQAYRASDSLRRFLNPHVDKHPFIVSTACWPKISRAEWNQYWGNPQVIGDFADRMLFSEDASNSDTFVERLKFIYKNPPVRKGSWRSFRHNGRQFEELKSLLQPVARPKPTLSDKEKIRVIEETITRKIRKEIPAYSAKKICFSGHPGTGKTFRLLQIGVEHACKDARVLFACFNKVLASDIRRLLSMSKRLSMTDEGIDVFDIFDLAGNYSDGISENTNSEDSSQDKYDNWGKGIVRNLEEEANKGSSIAQYDTILIDECQDMRDWHFRLLALHARDNSTICVAIGPGQELYSGAKSDWLEKFQKSAEVKNLRRNFRNPKPVFAFATIFYESALNLDKIENQVQRVAEGNVGDYQASVVPRIGQLPELILIDDSDNPLREDEPGFSQRQNEVITTKYQKLIKSEIETLQGNGNPIDLLLLVPGRAGIETDWVQKALRESGVKFIDYTKKENRRDTAGIEQVRLCTFHSARGIEGSRVLIFGIQQIEKLAKKNGTTVKNLGYIALSRSSDKVKIIMRDAIDNKTKKFLCAEIEHLKRDW